MMSRRGAESVTKRRMCVGFPADAHRCRRHGWGHSHTSVLLLSHGACRMQQGACHRPLHHDRNFSWRSAAALIVRRLPDDDNGL